MNLTPHPPPHTPFTSCNLSSLFIAEVKLDEDDDVAGDGGQGGGQCGPVHSVETKGGKWLGIPNVLKQHKVFRLGTKVCCLTLHSKSTISIV